jgi:hypothetical protein
VAGKLNKIGILRSERHVHVEGSDLDGNGDVEQSIFCLWVLWTTVCRLEGIADMLGDD